MVEQLLIDYTDPDVVKRQNVHPNAGCEIDGQFVDIRNLLHIVAELEAENERLTTDRDFWKERFQVETRARIEAEALSRTGAVNALPERAPYEILQVLGREYETSGEMWAAIRSVLSALEPAVPEGQQPVAWQWRQRPVYKTTGHKGEWSIWAEGRAPFLRVANYEAEERPLYTRPAEQAVTEADFDLWWGASKYRQVIFAGPDQRQVALDGWNAALKAAMEAGG